MVAQLLEMPYYFFTCGEGTDETDLVSAMIPNIGRKETKPAVRMRMIHYCEPLTAKGMVERVLKRVSGMERETLEKMAETVCEIQKYCRTEMITGGVCGYREFEDWVWASLVQKDICAAAKRTVVAKAAPEAEEREEIEEKDLSPEGIHKGVPVKIYRELEITSGMVAGYQEMESEIKKAAGRLRQTVEEILILMTESDRPGRRLWFFMSFAGHCRFLLRFMDILLVVCLLTAVTGKEWPCILLLNLILWMAKII